MNRLQYLLTKLAEEANEVGQMALKTQQFGLDEVYIDKSNRERLYAELNDLNAIVQMLNTEYDFGYLPQLYSISEKIRKVNHYYEYSKSLGLVT